MFQEGCRSGARGSRRTRMTVTGHAALGPRQLPLPPPGAWLRPGPCRRRRRELRAAAAPGPAALPPASADSARQRPGPAPSPRSLRRGHPQHGRGRGERSAGPNWKILWMASGPSNQFLLEHARMVSYISQDCEEIPEFLGRKYGHMAKRLDLSFNLLRISGSVLDVLKSFLCCPTATLDDPVMDSCVGFHFISTNSSVLCDCKNLSSISRRVLLGYVKTNIFGTKRLFCQSWKMVLALHFYYYCF
nr:leucine-rich melanocyte differentiation-associated protein isoform X3 [Zonotrichia albicollis]